MVKFNPMCPAVFKLIVVLPLLAQKNAQRWSCSNGWPEMSSRALDYREIISQAGRQETIQGSETSEVLLL